MRGMLTSVEGLAYDRQAIRITCHEFERGAGKIWIHWIVSTNAHILEPMHDCGRWWWCRWWWWNKRWHRRGRHRTLRRLARKRRGARW